MPEKPLFGYKAHVAVDQGSGLVRRAIFTPAHVFDKTPFLALVQGDEQAVYADKGYESRWFRERLAEQGIADGVMRCDFHRRRLTPADHARNRALSKVRAPSSAASRSSSAGTATAACTTARCCATRCSCNCWPAP